MDQHLGSITRPQLDALREFLSVNKDVAAGDTCQDMLRYRSSWETATVVLNAIEDDCCRGWRSWAQFWIDTKFQIRQKMYHQLLRGDQQDQVMLSDIETRFSQFVDNIGTPLEHIRQKISESRIENDGAFSTNDIKLKQKQGSDNDINDPVKSESSSEDDKPLSNNARRRRVIQPQLDALFEALGTNQWVTAGCNKSAESRHHYRKFWEKAATTLNAIPEGDRRNWRSWAKYWVDYKAKANKKIRSVKNGDTSIELSSNDLIFMQIINDTPNTPKGPIKMADWIATNVENKEIDNDKDKEHSEVTNKTSDEESETESDGDSACDMDIDALSRQRRRRIVNTDQLAALYQCLEHNKMVALGHTKSTKSRYDARIVWKKAAKILNAIPDGDVKDWKGWSKYWIDLKAKTKKRVSQVRAGHYRQPLTSLEIKFMQLINVDVSDLTASETISNQEANNCSTKRKQHTEAVSNDEGSDDDRKQSHRVSLEQLNVLWECLNDNREVAFGSNNTSELRMKALKMWVKTAGTLNAIKDGDTKTWKAWSKYWVDLKGKINHRVRRIKAGHKDVLLTPSDRRFLDLIRMADSDKTSNNGDHKNDTLKRQKQCSSDDGAATDDKDIDSDVDDKVHGCRRVSLAQQNALWACLNDNKEVAFGFNKTAESRHCMREMWTETAHILNRIKDGDVKTWKAWSKYWVDVKAKLNSRLRRIQAGDTDLQLTNTDLKFLQLIQANSKASQSKSCNHYDILATAEMDEEKPPKKKKKKHKQNSKQFEESLDSGTSSNLLNFEENSDTSDFKPLKQEHIELEGTNLNSEGTNLLEPQLELTPKNAICADCTLDQDSIIRNQAYSNLLMNELQYLPACMRSQAYINMLRYLECLKSKHSNKININSTQKNRNDYTSGVCNDPLNDGIS